MHVARGRRAVGSDFACPGRACIAEHARGIRAGRADQRVRRDATWPPTCRRVVFRPAHRRDFDMKHRRIRSSSALRSRRRTSEDALLASGSIPIDLRSGARHRRRTRPATTGTAGSSTITCCCPIRSSTPRALSAFRAVGHPGLARQGPAVARPTARPRWLANVILIAPSRAMLARLPNGKLPDRNDFYRYDHDQRARIAAWERAIAEAALRRRGDALAAVAGPLSCSRSVKRPRLCRYCLGAHQCLRATGGTKVRSRGTAARYASSVFDATGFTITISV